MLNRFRWFRERHWTVIDADTYAEIWQQYGGSVATHPQIIERLSALAKIPVRYLAWMDASRPVAAIATWDHHLALSRDLLKRRGKRGLFDLGNAEVILPMASDARIVLRHHGRYLSALQGERIAGAKVQKEQLALAREPEALSRKFRYNQRRELRLLQEAGGRVVPMQTFSATDQAAIYSDLFERRWSFETPGKRHLAEVFECLGEFMRGSVIQLDDRPIAIQILYQVESPRWISVEYVNGGVDPQNRSFSPGSVLSFLNTQAAWEEAQGKEKALRFSFGRADREYKDRWCHRTTVYQA